MMKVTNKLVFPVKENMIFKPKVSYTGGLKFIKEDVDAYGYRFYEWETDQPIAVQLPSGGGLTTNRCIPYRFIPSGDK